MHDRKEGIKNDISGSIRKCKNMYRPVLQGLSGLQRKACGNKVPGPGAKGTGTVAIQNYDAWQKISINMDTICENKPVDTTFELLDRPSSIRSLPDRWGL